MQKTRHRIKIVGEQLVRPWRERPPRLREPLFAPERELARIVERCRRAKSDPRFTLQAFETHQPVLLALLAAVPGARVLELGTGYGSTPIVLSASESSLSVETDRAWHQRFRSYATDSHRLELLEDFDEVEWRSSHLFEPWDIALVDNSPGTTRQSNLGKLAAATRFVVCHDTQECFGPAASNFGWDFSSFKHVWTYTRFETYTTVVSNHAAIPSIDLPGVDGSPTWRSPADA